MGNFKLKNINIITIGFTQRSSTLSRCLINMNNSSIKMITKDWSDAEKERCTIFHKTSPTGQPQILKKWRSLRGLLL